MGCSLQSQVQDWGQDEFLALLNKLYNLINFRNLVDLEDVIKWRLKAPGPFESSHIIKHFVEQKTLPFHRRVHLVNSCCTTINEIRREKNLLIGVAYVSEMDNRWYISFWIVQQLCSCCFQAKLIDVLHYCLYA